jgi:hypothetical protein
MEANGLMNQQSKAKALVGYTDTATVKLDLDKFTYKKTKYTALRVCKWFRLQGFIILKSSSKCYHVVFNKAVSWRQNQAVMGWACYATNFNLPLLRYLAMQCIKKSSTLRISGKGRKKPPKIIYRYGEQNSMIRNYLKTRREIRNV